jgi:hypothetical protein
MNVTRIVKMRMRRFDDTTKIFFFFFFFSFSLKQPYPVDNDNLSVVDTTRKGCKILSNSVVDVLSCFVPRHQTFFTHHHEISITLQICKFIRNIASSKSSFSTARQHCRRVAAKIEAKQRSLRNNIKRTLQLKKKKNITIDTSKTNLHLSTCYESIAAVLRHSFNVRHVPQFDRCVGRACRHHCHCLRHSVSAHATLRGR